MPDNQTIYWQLGRAVSAIRQFREDPRGFLRKVSNKAKGARSLFVIDKGTKRFIRHNEEVWWRWSIERSDATILVDFYSLAETIISYSYFLNVLAKKHNATIKSFAPTIGNPALHRVYQSFNTTGHIVTRFSAEQRRRKQAIIQAVLPHLQTKQDVFDLTVLGIWIGIDIYETYLKTGKPTIFLEDPKLFEIVEEAIGLVIFWQDFLAKKNVAAVVVSHDCYIDLDLPCKVAYQRNIPVYCPTIRSMAFLDRPHSGYSFLREYRQIFSSLSRTEQVDGISWAKKQIERRLSGEVGVDMPYSTKSAFVQAFSEVPILRRSDKIKVLICTHCFYDNPHGLGGMLFVDFFEWLRYLGGISEKTDYDWYIKMHPDPLPGTEEIIREILKEFPRLTWVPPETSHHQLAKEGINFVLTLYGSVGHEYPALGVQVINAGYNPRIAYDFNWHPKTLEEYEYYLLNLDKLKKESKLEEVYEFYYMHHSYMLADNLFLKSYRQYLEETDGNQRKGAGAYTYFLNQLTGAKHEEIIANIESYLASRKRYYFSHGPVCWI